MIDMLEKKVGIISCSGEGCVEGTISRIATRLVLEKFRPRDTVTICLPLFLAGGREERAFARDYPTITVDGCNRLCAKIGTERYSGRPESSVIVTELKTNPDDSKARSSTKLDNNDMALVDKVAAKIAQEVDKILNHWRQ